MKESWTGWGGCECVLVQSVEFVQVNGAVEEIGEGHRGVVDEGGGEVLAASSFEAGDECDIADVVKGDVLPQRTDVLDKTVGRAVLSKATKLLKVVVDRLLRSGCAGDEVDPPKEGMGFRVCFFAISSFHVPPPSDALLRWVKGGKIEGGGWGHGGDDLDGGGGGWGRGGDDLDGGGGGWGCAGDDLDGGGGLLLFDGGYQLGKAGDSGEEYLEGVEDGLHGGHEGEEVKGVTGDLMAGAFIEQYDFEPEYLKGEYNKVVDALSRRPDFSCALITEFGLADDVSRSLVEAYHEDLFMDEIIWRLEAKDKATSTKFELVNGLLFLDKDGNKRLCVQNQLAAAVLVAHNDERRQAVRGGLSETLGETLFMDFMDTRVTSKSGMCYVYVIVDRLSKYARLVAMPATVKTEYVIRLFKENWVRDIGLPKSFVSDKDARFTIASDLGSGPATQLHRGESRGEVEASSEVDLEASEGQSVEQVTTGGLGSQGAPQKRRGDRPDEFAGSAKKLKSKPPRSAGEKHKGTEGEQGRQGLPSTSTPGRVRTKREFEISPAQVVDLGDREDLYNQRSLDPVLVEGIKEVMRLAFENKVQSYDLPTLKLVPLGLDKPTPGTKAERLRPEDWRDELAGQYYYYEVCGQHNTAAARSLLGSEVARKYNFERWPARMVDFSDDDFEGYFLVSSQDNKKDLKTPPRQLKLSMRDIRWQWKRAGGLRAVMGNPSGKQSQVRKWHELCNVALNMTPHNNLWILVDQKGEEAIRKQGTALRSYFPLAMAGENVWKLAVEFFEKWETGGLLGHDGAKWIMRKKKVKNVQPGVAYIDNDKLGRKEVVYNVPVDPPTKKGKKEKEEGEWFVQVPEQDAHCWKTMDSLTDNEKCRVLKKVLACKLVWVQAGSLALAKLGKLSVQEMVHLVKCDRVLVHLWNYYQFKHDKKPDADWSQRCSFLKSRLKSREIALAEGIVHIKWKDTGDMTSIAPFGNHPLEADIRSAEVKEAVVATKSHTFILNLCEPVDLKLWKLQAFDTLDSQLQTWCPSHWTLVVFIPWHHNLSFLASMNHLSFFKLLEGKWVRRSQQKKSFPVGNNSYTEDDRMYILFKGDDLHANTSVVYEGKLPAGAAAAVRLPQKVTQTDVSDIPFNPCNWSYTSPARQGNVYGDMERNPAQFVNLLESVTKKGEGVVFLGKPHTRLVWEVLKAGRHVIAMEGNSELLQLTIDLVKSEVNSGAHNCEFMVVTETWARAWNNKKDMWFKLSARKQNKIYDFLFLQTRPKKDTDAEYVRRKDHVFTEEELTFGSYSSLISTEDEETTGIEFDVTADEEGSDTESLDLQYDPHPAQHATGSSLVGPSTSPTSLVSPMAKPAPGTTPMKLLQRLQALASDHRSLRPGSDIPPDHLSWKDANIHFLPEPQSRSTEADWGHDMIWHPGVIQPAIQKGEWIVAVAVPDGGWMPLPCGSKSDFLYVARIAVLQKVRAENDSFAPEDVSVISTAGRLFAELQDQCWLEPTEDYYDLNTSPSKGRVDWKIPPPSGTHVSTGSRGPDGGENEGDEVGGGKGVPPGSEGGSHDDTTTAEGSGGVAGEAFGRQQSTGPSPEGSAQSADVPTSSAGSVMAALVALRAGSVETFKSAGIRTSMLAERTKRTNAQSWSGAGVASRDPKIDSGAVRDGNAPLAGDQQPLRAEREGTCGGSDDRETAKFTRIRTSSGKGGQPGIVVPTGGAACGGREGHSSEFDTVSGEVAGLHAREEGKVMDKEKEGEEGDKGEELEEGGDEGEEEEDEGEEGEETELGGLLGGKEGEKGEPDTRDDERTFGDDNDRSGESSDGFGQLYGEHREEDDDDDDMAPHMETQVVTSLSAECDDYEVQAITSVVDLQHRFNEARVAVSLTKPSVHIDVEEVIDGILGDHHMSAQPSSTPGVDDPLDVKPSAGSVVAFSPTNSPMLPSTIATGGEGEIRGRQDVTSPKKIVAGTRALDVLALPAPTSPSKERRDKPAVRATTHGTAVTAIGSLRVLNDMERGLVPPNPILLTLGDGQLRIAAKDILTLSLTDGRVNDEVVNFYMALLGMTAYGIRDIASGLQVFSFNSFFFSKLQLQGHGGVERWAKNVDLL
ncbi:hypothetical protein CBR_g53502 [Chara braunii]|uniref:Integrase catalytic domain-containing protein n=1 Tax=Chara braunii TaxID=69332 RepID=A0A388MAU7_CHABU|nr:hypothetical protein CBR_g53502 [Chara braunii]|eukprot:GBG91688.1 hypothetical protein CBR_g53502 [Chara braunii]